MLSLLAAAVFFVGIHLFISGTRLRDAIVGRIGEQGFLAAFSLASLAGIVWLCMAYANATPSYLYPEVPALRWLVLALVFVAFQFVVIGLTTQSPTATGAGGTANSTPRSPHRASCASLATPFSGASPFGPWHT